MMKIIKMLIVRGMKRKIRIIRIARVMRVIIRMRISVMTVEIEW